MRGFKEKHKIFGELPKRVLLKSETCIYVGFVCCSSLPFKIGRREHVARNQIPSLTRCLRGVQKGTPLHFSFIFMRVCLSSLRNIY